MSVETNSQVVGVGVQLIAEVVRAKIYSPPSSRGIEVFSEVGFVTWRVLWAVVFRFNWHRRSRTARSDFLVDLHANTVHKSLGERSVLSSKEVAN